MNNTDIREMFSEIFRTTTENTIHLPEEDVDVPILEEPVIGFASASDPLFDELKNNPAAIGEGYMTPKEWLENARSVIVFFFPYTEEIRSRLANSDKIITEAWKYGYPTGSALAQKLAMALKEKLEESGLKVVNPVTDPRMSRNPVPDDNGGIEDLHFVVSWSTRHAGYVAGIGTFGMNRHIITEKGTCGSLATLITDQEFEVTERDYTGIYDYCIQCGQCGVNCPAKAMEPSGLRNLKKCSEYGAYLREHYGGGGCGRCMVGVPCEHRNPSHL